MNYWRGAKTSFTGPTSPSVTDVVQTFSWLFGSHDHSITRPYQPLTLVLIASVPNLCLPFTLHYIRIIFDFGIGSDKEKHIRQVH